MAPRTSGSTPKKPSSGTKTGKNAAKNAGAKTEPKDAPAAATDVNAADSPFAPPGEAKAGDIKKETKAPAQTPGGAVLVDSGDKKEEKKSPEKNEKNTTGADNPSIILPGETAAGGKNENGDKKTKTASGAITAAGTKQTSAKPSSAAPKKKGGKKKFFFIALLAGIAGGVILVPEGVKRGNGMAIAVYNMLPESVRGLMPGQPAPTDITGEESAEARQESESPAIADIAGGGKTVPEKRIIFPPQDDNGSLAALPPKNAEDTETGVTETADDDNGNTEADAVAAGIAEENPSVEIAKLRSELRALTSSSRTEQEASERYIAALEKKLRDKEQELYALQANREEAAILKESAQTVMADVANLVRTNALLSDFLEKPLDEGAERVLIKRLAANIPAIASALNGASPAEAPTRAGISGRLSAMHATVEEENSRAFGWDFLPEKLARLLREWLVIRKDDGNPLDDMLNAFNEGDMQEAAVAARAVYADIEGFDALREDTETYAALRAAARAEKRTNNRKLNTKLSAY